MLHQIFKYTNQVMFAAGLNNDTILFQPFTPSPSLLLDEQIDQ